MDVPAIRRIAFSEEVIRQKVCELGRQITEDYRDRDLVLLSVLKGTLYFFADLTRQIALSPMLDFISVGIYPGNQTGVVRIAKDLDVDIGGRACADGGRHHPHRPDHRLPGLQHGVQKAGKHPHLHPAGIAPRKGWCLSLSRTADLR